MISETWTPFINAIRQARLLSEAQLAEVASGLGTDSGEPRALARELMRRAWLTPFQVEKLAHGKGNELVLGKYVLLERLGEGGMGQVFKARHRVMDRCVAIKIIRPELLHHGSSVRRFHQEIRAVAQLSHPNIVLAHDADQDGDTHFLVMEYVEGIDLKRLVQTGGRLAVPLACEYIRQAALGLQHAHERGLVHRDLKPGNLLLSKAYGAEAHGGSSVGLIKILDLGLALLQSQDQGRYPSTDLTKSGALIGTPDYMAPEQAIDPRAVDIRADLYSLGCTLYFLLTGRAPFEDASMLEKLYRHKFESPTPLDALRPDVPVEVAAVIGKLMAKEQEDRYQVPAEVAQALAPFAAGAEAGPLHQAAKGPQPLEPRPSSSATLHSEGRLADTMSAPGASATDPLSGSTSGAAVSMERALDALFPPRATEIQNPPLPGASSASEFVNWDSQLDKTPRLAPPKERQRLKTALLFGAVILLGLSAGLALTALRGKSKEPSGEPAPPGPEATGAPSAPPSGKENPAKPEVLTRPTETLTVVLPPGQAKPLLAADDIASIIDKPDAGPVDPPRGESKPSSASELIACPVPLKRALDSASFSADGRRVVVGSEEVMAIYELRGLHAETKPMAAFKYNYQVLLGDKPPLHMGLAPGGDRVWLATVDRPVVKGQVRPPGPVLGWYEPDNPEPQHIFPCETARFTCLAVSPTDPHVVVTGDQRGTVAVWEIGDAPRLRRSWTEHHNVVEWLALSQDGTRALSGDRSGKLWVWDLGSSKPLQKLIGHDQPLRAMALSPDGKLAASAGEDHTVRLWDTAGGKQEKQLPERFADAVTCLTWLDGKRLLTGAKDGTVCLWGVSRDAPLRSWRAGEAVLAVALAPEGDAVIAVGRDNTIRRWGFYPPAGAAR
jgi:serine/threonine-protein kinase